MQAQQHPGQALLGCQHVGQAIGVSIIVDLDGQLALSDRLLQLHLDELLINHQEALCRIEQAGGRQVEMALIASGLQHVLEAGTDARRIL